MPKFREITGQFVGYVPDSIDPDFTPDREPMNGLVKFTPVYTGGVIAFPELSPPEFAKPQPIYARIIDGFVRVEVLTGGGEESTSTMQPLYLMVTVDDEATQAWSWRAEFSNITFGQAREEAEIPSWSFRIPDGVGPIDLAEMLPIKSSTGGELAKGPRGAGLQNITAVDGQLVFAYTDGEESIIDMPEAVQGPEGPEGPRGPRGEVGATGEKGDPGEIPDLLVGNITDATPTGKNLMLAATEGAARDAIGLQAGATATNGALSELNNGTQTNSRVWSARNLSEFVGGKDAESTYEAVQQSTEITTQTVGAAAADPGLLNTVRVEAVVKFRANTAEGTWVQGFNYDPDENMYYIGTQDSSEYKIQRVNKSTGVMVDQKSFPITPGAYTESLPYWRNGSGDLCFMVRTGADASESTYNIFNYTTGNLGAQIPIKGIWRAGRSGGLLITSDSRTTDFRRYYFYEWESVKAGTPSLSSTVVPGSFGETGRKNQGLQIVGSNFYVQQAAVGEPPTLNKFSMNGALESTTQWPLTDFGALVNSHTPGTIVNTDNFKLEGEGLAEHDGRLLSGWSVNEGDSARYVIVSHGHADGERLPARTVADPLSSIAVNVSLSGLNCWLKRQGAFVSVWIDGAISPGLAAGSSVTIGTLSPEFRPGRMQRHMARVGSGVTGQVEIKSDGSVAVINLSSTSATFLSAFSTVYDVSF